MLDLDKLKTCVETALEGTDCYIVSLKCTPSNDIELLLDSDTHVSLDMCSDLTRRVEEEFNRDEEDYSMMVASAGIGEPLTLVRQYRRLVGSKLEIVTLDGQKRVVDLVACDDSSIRVSYTEMQAVEGKKRKQKVLVEKDLAYSELSKAVEYIDFK